jgi:chromosome segregation ATPase
MATHAGLHVDTHAESEGFDAIVQDARSVVAHMDEVKQRFDSVGHRVEQMEGAMEQSKNTIAAAVKELEDAVHHTVTNLAALVGDGDSKYHELFSKIESWTTELKSAREQFDQSSKHAQSAVDHSQTLSQQLLEQVKHTAHTFVESSKERVNDLHEHVTELGKQFEAQAHPAMTGFDEFLTHMREQSETYSHSAHDHVDQLQHQVDNFVHAELIAPVVEHANQAVQFLASVGHADVAGAVTTLMHQGREALEDGVKAVIGDLTDAVGHEIDTVTQAIHHAGGENEGVREALKPVFDLVDELIEPVEETIGNVKSIAAAVGVDL